jgi:hypothetical protein
MPDTQLHTLNSIWLPRDETAMDTDCFNHMLSHIRLYRSIYIYIYCVTICESSEIKKFPFTILTNFRVLTRCINIYRVFIVQASQTS